MDDSFYQLANLLPCVAEPKRPLPIIMALLSKLVEVNEKITTACHDMWDADMGEGYEYAELRLLLEEEAKNIMTEAMELAHIIGCTIWCDAKHDTLTIN